MLRTLRTIGCVLGAAVASGCYTYVPMEQPRPQTEVRVTVPIRSAVDRPNREPETYSVEGVLVSASDTVVLETRSRAEAGAFREVVRLDTLRVARGSIMSLDEKVFSTPKTIGLTAVLVGGAVGLVSGLLSITTGDDGDGGPDGGGDTNQIRIDPIFGSLLRLLSR